MSSPTNTPRSFTSLVRAEQPARHWSWHARDTVAVLAIPAIFLAGWLSLALSASPTTGAVLDTALRLVIFAVLAVANAALLAEHWRRYRAAFWRSTGLVVLGMVVIQVVISVLGAVLRPFDQGATGSGDAASTELAFGVMLFASLGPTVTALIEDFTFRHTLLMKVPAWGRPVTAVALVLVNALVFGLIHVENFGGHWLMTLSYAGAGLVMNLVYLWTRNIWHVLLMHGLNNFILGGPLTVLLVHALSGAVG